MSMVRNAASHVTRLHAGRKEQQQSDAVLQVKELNMEEGGAFTVSSAEEILAGLSK